MLVVAAGWLLIVQKQHPEDLVVSHFIGSSPQSVIFSAALGRIMLEVLPPVSLLRTSFPLRSASAPADPARFPLSPG